MVGSSSLTFSIHSSLSVIHIHSLPVLGALIFQYITLIIKATVIYQVKDILLNVPENPPQTHFYRNAAVCWVPEKAKNTRILHNVPCHLATFFQLAAFTEILQWTLLYRHLYKALIGMGTIAADKKMQNNLSRLEASIHICIHFIHVLFKAELSALYTGSTCNKLNSQW